MIPDIDVWRCAAQMIRRYGDTARTSKQHRVPTNTGAKVNSTANVFGCASSMAIDALQKVEPGEPKH